MLSSRRRSRRWVRCCRLRLSSEWLLDWREIRCGRLQCFACAHAFFLLPNTTLVRRVAYSKLRSGASMFACRAKLTKRIQKPPQSGQDCQCRVRGAGRALSGAYKWQLSIFLSSLSKLSFFKSKPNELKVDVRPRKALRQSPTMSARLFFRPRN
jgi:hypothetical protein